MSEFTGVSGVMRGCCAEAVLAIPRKQQGNPTTLHGTSRLELSVRRTPCPAFQRNNVVYKALRRGRAYTRACAGIKPHPSVYSDGTRVPLLKLKESSGLLKSRESSKEFNGCPVIGGTDDGEAAVSSY
jgi:hypothetical protein